MTCTRRRSARRAARTAAGAVVLLATVIAGGTAQAHQPAAPGAPARSGDAATSRHTFEDVRHWQAVFDDPARDEWQKPGALVEALGIRRGMTVADVGAGTGYLSRHLAAAVGEDGTVFAADTEPALVRHLRQRAETEGTPQVVPVLASADNPRLPAGGVDLVLFLNTIHHIDGRIAYLRRLRRALRVAGGRVAVVDFLPGQLPVGPPPDHKLAPEQVIAEFGAAGYALLERPAVLPWQYVLVFAPAPASPPAP